MSTTADALWAGYVAAHPELAGRPAPAVHRFGFSAEAGDDVARQVLDAQKRATADLLVDYAASAKGMPGPGDHWLVADGQDNPVAVLRTVTTRVGKVSTVDEEFAWYDGLGDRSVDTWLQHHREIFADQLPADTEGLEFEPVVFETFVLVWPPDRITEHDVEQLSWLD